MERDGRSGRIGKGALWVTRDLGGLKVRYLFLDGR